MCLTAEDDCAEDDCDEDMIFEEDDEEFEGYLFAGQGTYISV